MSIASILSGNFHQLKNSLGSIDNFKLLRYQCGAFGNVAVIRRCRSQPISAKAVGENRNHQNSKSRTVNLKLLGEKSPAKLNSEIEFHKFASVQSCSPENKISDSRSLEWPAAVIAFDIETTGFSYRKEKIIEIAFLDLHGGRDSAFETLVNPEKKVLNARIHGISTHMVTKPGVPRMKDLIPIILKYVESRQTAGKPVMFVAHNGRRFDIPFFVREFNRCSAEVPSDWLFIDTLPLAHKLVKPDGSKLPSRSLQALREHYGIPLLGPSHRAMQDVMVLSLVLQKMSFELKLSVMDLMERAFKASDVVKDS